MQRMGYASTGRPSSYGVPASTTTTAFLVQLPCPMRGAPHSSTKGSGLQRHPLLPSPGRRALLDACDRYGVLVMDELSDVWNVRKNPYDYALYFEQDWKPTIQKIVAKDYNHPVSFCTVWATRSPRQARKAERRPTVGSATPSGSWTPPVTPPTPQRAYGSRLPPAGDHGGCDAKFPAQPGPSGGDGGGSNA